MSTLAQSEVEALRAEVARLRRALQQRDQPGDFLVLTQAMPQLVWTCGPDGSVDFVNQQWLDYTGQTVEHALGSGLFNAVHPDDIDDAQRSSRDALRTAAPYKSEWRIQRHADGQYRSHLISAFPIPDATGAAVKWVGTCTDIEDQKRAEQAIRESERRYRFLADAMPQFVWISDTDGRIEYANDFLLRYMGITLEEAQRRRWQNVIHRQDLPRVIERVQQSIATGEDFEAEYRLRIPRSRTYRWFFARARLVRGGGGTAHWLGTGLDIDDRKRAEDEIQRLNQDLARRVREFETLLDVTPAGIGIAYDRPCDYIRFNRAFSEWIGIGEDGVVAGTSTKGVPLPYRVFENGRELTASELPLRVAAREGRQVESQVTILRRDGRKVDIWGFATPLFDETGVPRGSMCVFLDITERNAIEGALRRANADLEQFAYAASHDLQEPIRSVGLYAQLLERNYAGKLDHDAGEMISVIVDGARRMHTLVQDLLAYTRAIEATSSSEHTEAAAAFDDALFNLKTAIDESEADVTHGALPEVAMSRTHLAQVLQNLIGNAIKYRGEEHPRIRVSAAFDGTDWVFTVADNGIGIDHEHHQRIFGVFKRLHGREIPGTGVGLAICSRIIGHHGGRIWVESDPGHGSRFSFTVPSMKSTSRS